MPGPHDYTDRTVKKLYALSLNRCYNPTCDHELVFPEGNSIAHVGKICHIRGANKDSLRYDENMTDDERRSFDNLIVLCGYCHDKIDDEEAGLHYTVEMLKNWKSRLKGNEWLPGDHFDEWGEYNWTPAGRKFKLPYYKIGDDIRFFTEEQYAQCEKALFLGIELSMIHSFIDQVRNYSKNGIAIPVSEVEKMFTQCVIPSRHHPDWFDPKNSTVTQRLYMLMKDNNVRLKDVNWINTAGNERRITIIIDKN
jgi:hypothetical protein